MSKQHKPKTQTKWKNEGTVYMYLGKRPSKEIWELGHMTQYAQLEKLKLRLVVVSVEQSMLEAKYRIASNIMLANSTQENSFSFTPHDPKYFEEKIVPLVLSQIVN